MKRKQFLILGATAALTTLAEGILPGCAKNPATVTTTGTSKFLTVTLRLRGQIDTSLATGGAYYYFLINRTDNKNDKGPVPVVDRPWGNGFAAPDTGGTQGFVGYVLFSKNASQGGALGGYSVYSAQSGSQILNPVTNNFTYIGAPNTFTLPQQGDSVLTFRLDLGRLPFPNAQYLQFNIVTTDNTPQGADDALKHWDAFGNGSTTGTINNYLTIDVTQNRLIRMVDAGPDFQEPTTSDVRDHLGATLDYPSLDIADWSVEISSQ